MNASPSSGTRVLDRAGLLAALATFACAVAFPVLTAVHSGVHLQPTDVPLSPAEFAAPLHDRPEAVLLWMGFDALFVLAYVVTFTAARGLTVSRVLGNLSMGAMIVTGALDMVENAVLAVHAAQAAAGEPFASVPAAALYTVAQLKGTAATAGIGLLALALPTGTRLLRAAVAAAAAFVAVTAVGVAVPALAPLEALPILLLTGLLAAVFAGRLRAAAPGRGPAAPAGPALPGGAAVAGAAG
ncbi:hypothetical protein [Streptomyces sp. NPDC048001]|uniref:hypothetical protein n=1 Tax=unclassified Streptomyces TaxID=2593676 RepID=UPI0037198DF7